MLRKNVRHNCFIDKVNFWTNARLIKKHEFYMRDSLQTLFSTVQQQYLLSISYLYFFIIHSKGLRKNTKINSVI